MMPFFVMPRRSHLVYPFGVRFDVTAPYPQTWGCTFLPNHSQSHIDFRKVSSLSILSNVCPKNVFFVSRTVSSMSWGSKNLYARQCKHLYTASCMVYPTPLNSCGSVMNLSWNCVTDFNSPTFCWTVNMTTSSNTQEWWKCCR